jgi:hypothetical protein
LFFKRNETVGCDSNLSGTQHSKEAAVNQFRCYLLSTKNDIANFIDFESQDRIQALAFAKATAETAGAAGYELWEADEKLCAALTGVPIESIGCYADELVEHF